MARQEQPNATDVERSLLGSLLLDQTLMGSATTYLGGPEALYDGRHNAIYSAMVALYDEGEDVDIVTVSEQLERTRQLKRAGGTEYLAELTESCVTSPNVERYCRILHDRHLRRETIKGAAELQQAAQDLERDLPDVMEVQDGLSETLEEMARRSGVVRVRSGRLVRVKADLGEKVRNYREHGFQNVGVHPGWNNLAGYYRVAKGTLNIVTGIPSHGKSELMDSLMVNLSRRFDWRWAVYSPENYPYELHLQKLAEKYLETKWKEMTDADFDEALAWLDRHLILIEPDEDNLTLTGLLRLIREAVQQDKIDGVVIDPWNEISLPQQQNERETVVINRALSRCRWLARRNNLAWYIVAHPTKMFRDKQTQEYVVPRLYDISGSAAWFNKADNGLSIYRDFNEHAVDVYIQKVRFKVHGHPGKIRLWYQDPPGVFAESTPDDGMAGWDDNTPTPEPEDQMSWIHD